MSTHKDDVSAYFSELQETYDESMAEYDHYSIHYGYFDERHDSRQTAVENMTRVLAERAEVTTDDTVLHCGCGIGGPATWVADKYNAETIGVNINEMQLERARRVAEERGVDDATEFRQDDFTRMQTVDNDSVDVVWGLEAICYADDERDFLRQAQRVLTDGGRLVVGGPFRSRRGLDTKDRRLLDGMLDAWRVPNLAHVDVFTDVMEDLGFTDTTACNETEYVLPFARGTFLHGLTEYPVAKLRQLLGRASETETEHILGRYYQYRSLVRGAWTYQIVTGRV